MKTAFIMTVLNEEDTISPFLSSLIAQSILPDEIIIVDGGSSDRTLSEISNFKFQISHKNKKKTVIRLISKPGNRSVGRNEAIAHASADIILISDAGCTLDKDWVKEIILPFSTKDADVVSGYYQGKANSLFEKCLIPYVLVMEDKLDYDNFLPATRSMAIKKTVWEKVGKFPEQYSHNEDYVFAHKLRNNMANIVFTKKALVYWIPRSNIRQSFYMFYRFALGDAEAKIFRKKVLILFLRYLLAIILFTYILFTASIAGLTLLISIFVLYCTWAIMKNYRYVHEIGAVFILPLLQFTADIAVISGTIKGLAWGIQKKQ